MANTYSQIHLHFIFCPKYRLSLIDSSWENELFRYICGITERNNHKMISINGMADHLHMLVGFRTNQSIADFMQDVKADSSQWINRNKFCKSRFDWQTGYGVFSYSKSQISDVINYIQNQKQHHKKINFLDEYKLILQKFEVDYNEQYIFKHPE
ncbi:IS200/IS605 family transposase [Dyadobacter luteus]|uniref:IS200/IS605 family transposase n=1 Tax=Dyadobacter luteus TaxID=2259619 RepID=A0A3D8Y658_9BACT|nr:IS200/IS605 family transposase [Dyadobacter luteus]REA57929.1 IS200/IS605 family transposase [Dyadobacter luteus]